MDKRKSVLVVPPGGDSRGIETLSPLEFLSSQREEPANRIDCIVIAGVGSSALRTAALAHNTADYLARPLAGIVSGYGLADLLAKALGGGSFWDPRIASEMLSPNG